MPLFLYTPSGGGFQRRASVLTILHLSHLDTIIRQDLLDLERIRDLKSFEILIHLLKIRVCTMETVQAALCLWIKKALFVLAWRDNSY